MKSHARQPSVLEYTSYREFLRDYVEYSRSKVRSWSYTTWARKLGLASKSSLVMILSGTRNPGPELIAKLTESLGFNQHEADHFSRLVQSEKKTLDPVSRLVFVRSNESGSTLRRRQWLFLVLIDLTQIASFVEDTAWIRDKILRPVDESDIKKCLEEMIADGFLERDVTGRLHPVLEKIKREAGGALAEKEILQFHQDGFLASHEALLKSSLDDRTFRTSVLRVSKDRLAEANLILQETQRQLSQLLESTDGDSLYELHLHLFPLTRELD